MTTAAPSRPSPTTIERLNRERSLHRRAHQAFRRHIKGCAKWQAGSFCFTCRLREKSADAAGNCLLLVEVEAEREARLAW